MGSQILVGKNSRQQCRGRLDEEVSTQTMGEGAMAESREAGSIWEVNEKKKRVDTYEQQKEIKLGNEQVKN